MAGDGVRGVYPARNLTARTLLHSSAPQKCTSTCCQLRFRAEGGRALWDWEAHSRLSYWSGGAGVSSPSPPPHMSLSRQKGPVCHVVDQPANMRAPPPFHHLARWEGGAQKPSLVSSLVFHKG